MVTEHPRAGKFFTDCRKMTDNLVVYRVSSPHAGINLGGLTEYDRLFSSIHTVPSFDIGG